MCTHPLDAQTRGSMCGTCWILYVRSFYDSPEDVQLVRKSLTTMEGASAWFLPDDAVLAVSDEEVTQLTLLL